MPRGGRRTGAGRKPGALTSKTRAAVKTAVEEGITPIEVMLKAMRLLEEQGHVIEAAEMAKEVAPYVHPKMLALEITGKGGQPLTFKQLEVILRRLR